MRGSVAHERPEAGAAAVEFAILLPLLVLILGGVMDIGRLLYYDITASNAAREGVRMVALGMPGLAADRARASVPDSIETQFVFPSGGTCAPGGTAIYTVTSDFTWILLDGLLPIATPDASATASMACGG